MSEAKQAEIVLLPVPLFILELHSERMIDLFLALNAAGFTVNQVDIKGFHNRYRIDDEKELRP